MTEWQVIVHNIPRRDLPSAEINPNVCIQIDEQKRSTVVQKSSKSPFFTFDITLPAAQIMEKMFYFKVHHANKFLSQFTDTTPIDDLQRERSFVRTEMGATDQS